MGFVSKRTESNLIVVLNSRNTSVGNSETKVSTSSHINSQTTVISVTLIRHGKAFW